MRGFINIVDVADKLRYDFNWGHSFVRELYCRDMHRFVEYINPLGDRQIGDVDGSLDIRMLIAANGNPSIFGIELLCFGVIIFSMQKLNELSFDLRSDVGSVTIDLGNKLIGEKDCWIVAKEIKVGFWDKDYLGSSLKLGFEIPQDNAITAIPIGDYWRQCSNCSNAWNELPQNIFSRCTGCGELTKLEVEPDIDN
jgi:hypothetical protein